MGGCCRWAWLVRQGDTPDEARVKTTVFPFALFMLLVECSLLWRQLVTHNQMVAVVGFLIISFAMVLFMGGVVFDAVRPGFLLDVVLVLCTVGMCAQDLGTVTRDYSFRSWFFTVLLVDAALLFKRNHIPRFIIPVVLIYSSAVQVESASRFGLYDLGYWGSEGVEISHCNCASPPCGTTGTDAFIGMLGVVIILLGDYYYTHGFATGMTLQLRRVEVSVDVAGEVAAALSRYDVDTAERAIARGTDLPPELAGSFRRLLSNLRLYRHYLPDTLLLQDEDAAGESPSVPPPLGEGGGAVDVG
eukprot:Hpha_TRINITY_DN15529_c6_g1::TRINITY_DN15529_c6_g1_i1::g.105993::m.105993